MFLKIVSIFAVCLLVMAVFLRPQNFTRTGLAWLVCLLALMSMMALARAKEKSWAVAFGVMALLFNPIIRLLPNSSVLLIDLLALLTFMTFLFTQAKPALTIASITSEAERKPSL